MTVCLNDSKSVFLKVRSFSFRKTREEMVAICSKNTDTHTHINLLQAYTYIHIVSNKWSIFVCLCFVLFSTLELGGEPGLKS